MGENQEPGDKLTIKFNFASPLTQSGRICLEASGKRVSGFEAERTALLSMLEKLRTEYGILNADYSYVVVARKRVLFEAMRNATTSLSRAYCMVDEAVVCSSIAVHKCATALTDWLSLHEHHLDRSTITAVSSFHEWAISSISSLSAAANGTSSVVRAMMERELGPEPMVRMFETSPMPMVCTSLPPLPSPLPMLHSFHASLDAISYIECYKSSHMHELTTPLYLCRWSIGMHPILCCELYLTAQLIM